MTRMTLRPWATPRHTTSVMITHPRCNHAHCVERHGGDDSSLSQKAMLVMIFICAIISTILFVLIYYDVKAIKAMKTLHLA